MFPTMRTICTKEMIPIVVEHLTALEENIDHYFPSLNTEKYDWVRNPFVLGLNYAKKKNWLPFQVTQS